MTLLTKEKVCTELGISLRGLEMMIQRNEFPFGVRIGKRLYWTSDAIAAWQIRLFQQQNTWTPGPKSLK